MQINEARSLIDNIAIPDGTARWADLGCGSGLFTRALASLLPEGSSIHAIDLAPAIQAGIVPGRRTTSDEAATGRMKAGGLNADQGVRIIPVKADFITGNLDLPELDGILMANSLHYVADKPSFLRKISAWLRPAAQFLIVEYDTDKPVSGWVPYPVSFHSLTRLFRNEGYPAGSIRKLGTRASIYNSREMYAAVAGLNTEALNPVGI